MDIFAKDSFVALAAVSQGPCISIYIPTHRGGQEVNAGADRIVYKNALAEVEGKLEESGMKPREINELLAQAQALYEDTGFWRQQSDMLAVFVAPGYFQHFALPLQGTKTITVNDKMYLAPLLPLMVDERYYYILSIAKGSVSLYEATPYTITDIQIEDLVPMNQEDALKFDDPEKSLQHHSGTRSGQAVYHGHGSLKDADTTNLQRYLQMVDNGIYHLLSQENVPLVLAGDKNVTGEYKKLSQYKLIMDETITGNTEYIPLAELHEMSRAIVKAHFNQEVTKAKERFGDMSNSTTASTDLKDVVLASYMQKVDTLMIRKQTEVWGEVDIDNQKVELNNDSTGIELLNQAAIQTILHGGKVFMLDGEMPTKNEVAAIYRY